MYTHTHIPITDKLFVEVSTYAESFLSVPTLVKNCSLTAPVINVFWHAREHFVDAKGRVHKYCLKLVFSLCMLATGKNSMSGTLQQKSGITDSSE